MKQTLNLAQINPNSMAAILDKNMSLVYAQTSVDGVYTVVADLFADNAINTKASNRLLANIKKASNVIGAQWTVTNSLLKGTGNGVI